ncbi:MAG TPA: ABC transporter permease [Pyrinomonadaceae bacterium]|jgi:putative ABC transport system permease protein|nr:ABC transporter permease [Pyrinomonadaceae bacterium]
MSTLLADIRFGVRMLLKSPMVTFVALLALTLGIGANTAIFSVVNGVLLRTFPYHEAERLVLVWEKSPRNDQNVINLGNFFDWKEQNQVFTDMAVFFDRSFNLTSDGEPEEVTGQLGTTNLFSVLGTNPVLGRTFIDDDGRDGQPRVIVISYGLWQRRFGGDKNIVGRQISVNERPSTIVGVMPTTFGWHIQKGTQASKPADIWIPFQIPEQLRQRRGRFASAVARLKPGVSIDQAQQEMTTIGARLSQQYPEFNTNWGVNAVPLRTQVTGAIRRPLFILLGAVGFVLLIACANVANLLLARASSRRKEIAVRAGLGATRRRIARQLLTESVILSLTGGTLGVLVAWWGTKALVALSPPALIDLKNVTVSLPVLAFTLGLSLLTGIVFGLVPALEATRFDLHDSLKEGGKNIGGSAGGQRVRNLFVVTQVALALVLLVGAGLLLKSFNRLQSVYTGFNPNNLLAVRLNLLPGKYDTDQKRIDFFKRAIEQMKTLPGVEAAGAINTPPFTGLYSGTNVEVDGQRLPPGQHLGTGICVTDANYFQTMGIPLKLGRLYNEQEASEMRHVVVVNETFVRKNLGGQNPLGRRLTIYMKDENLPSEIIGVVADHKHLGLDVPVEPVAYWPHPELVYPGMTLMLRTRGDAGAVAGAARNVIHSLDPQQPIGEVSTMETLLSTSVARARFSASLLTVFSFLALVMAAVGIYGVMSYSVLQRTHEIGVRMALGAQRFDVLKLVVRKGILLGVVGVVAGLIASFALTRLIATLLFDVTTTDTATFAIVSVGLFLVTLIACYVPARRATKVDPLKALRYE